MTSTIYQPSLVTSTDTETPGAVGALAQGSQLAALAEIARAASGAVDRMAFLPVVARAAVGMFEAAACEIWLNEQGPVLAATYRAPEARVETGPARDALEDALGGVPVLAGDWYLQPIPGHPSSGGVLAVLRPGAWSRDEVALLETVSSMLDLGMEVAVAGRMDDQSRDQFLALIGHDLRSPLSMVRVGAQLASRNLDAGDLQSVQQALKIIEAQSTRLVARLEALLEAVAADGRMLLRPEPLDMAQLAAQMIEPLRLAAEEQQSGTTFAVEAAPGSPPARGDRIQISQVLEHLLDNAAKYAPGGRITVRIEGSGNTVLTHVADTGPGIAPEDMERIFAPFGRGRSSAGKSGYGLGLYLARNITQAHGGKLWTSRSSRSGTCFTLALPASSEESA